MKNIAAYTKEKEKVKMKKKILGRGRESGVDKRMQVNVNERKNFKWQRCRSTL